MDYWAITNGKSAETEMGKDSFLEGKIFKILNTLSTRVSGSKENPQIKKELKISMFLSCAVILFIHIF